jgi:hypothetical protein
MSEGEQWSIFAGSSLKDQAKLNGLPMCGCWHTRGVCFLDCKNKASQVKCSEIPVDVKEAHMKWMNRFAARNRGSGRGLAVWDQDHCQNLPTTPPSSHQYYHHHFNSHHSLAP